MNESQSALPAVLMIGTGEYTTGYVRGAAAASDKGAGVVALALFDLRRRGLVGRLLMAGTDGTKFPGIRAHLDRAVAQRYRGLDTAFESYPGDDVRGRPDAYLEALERMAPGDLVTIFTPDDTHFEIALAAVRRGCHALVAKPLVRTLAEHRELVREAAARGVLVAMEVHKRWDPIYADARDRIRSLGDFSYFAAYMSQPKSQLDTFRAWAGKSSDISYYLNSHHVDFNVWAVGGFARPLRVRASASTGVARSLGVDAEDTITLAVDWENRGSGARATALYTASWIAPRSDVHSQQRFFYMGAKGEVTVDQAHRGYSVSTDAEGFRSPNPLFMKYEPDADGRFAGQSGYGYRSIEDFVLAARAIRADEAAAESFRGRLATAADTAVVTAILEAGRRSLDHDGEPVDLVYDAAGEVVGLD